MVTMTSTTFIAQLALLCVVGLLLLVSAVYGAKLDSNRYDPFYPRHIPADSVIAIYGNGFCIIGPYTC